MRVLNKVVIVAAVGTFVDVLDLTLFQSVRVPSLKALGVPPSEIFKTGVTILNFQLIGLLLGGVLWGTIADRRGRKTVLFASILVYSLATLASAWVSSVPMYAVVRLIAGFGLAGEFGAGITLIAEVLPPETRGWGTTLCAAFGLSGALAGGMLATHLPWRTDYVIGGVLGLCLLVARATTFESKLFESSKKLEVKRGVMTLLSSRARLAKFGLSLAIALPLFFVLLVISPFAPELAGALSPPHTVTAAAATSAVSIGLALGDVVNGFISQKLKSRKKPIFYSIVLITITMVVFMLAPMPSDFSMLVLIFVAGLGAGYYVLFLTNAAEQFGTNVRGSATVSAPNIMRATVIPMTLALRALATSVGLRVASLIVVGVCVVVALLALRALPETFGRNLEFEE